MMRRTAIALIAAAGLLSGAAAPAPKGPPAAGGATGDADLRCMLVASALSQNKEPQARNLSSLMVFYYLGRLDTRRPGLSLGPALQAEARAANPTEMQAIGQRCIATITGRAKALQALGGQSSPPAGAPPAAAPATPPPTQ